MSDLIHIINKKTFTLIASFIMSICCLSAYADKVPEDAAKVCPIKVGQEIPKVTLQGIDGKNVDLAAKIGEKPTVLVFYRGGWCPYCNVHLGELKTIESDLKAMGYQIVAISPDLPKNLKQSMDKNDISYTLLSDSKATAVKAMGLAFKVDAETYKKYLGYNIDLEEASGEKHHILPVPAALITDTSGKVRLSV